MKNNVKFNSKTNKMLMPSNLYNIEDIGEMLTEKSMYITVNLSEYKSAENIAYIMNFIINYSTSYACVRCRKISKKYFLCWSEHKEQC